jgi:hypothetical protein
MLYVGSAPTYNIPEKPNPVRQLFMGSGTALVVGICLAVVAAACGGSSPTAPTPIAAAAAEVVPFPAPVSQTMTGTWTANGWRFTVAQRDNTFTGMVTPFTLELDGRITVDEYANVNGVVSGNDITFTQSDRITIQGPGLVLQCTAGATFRGTLSGNTLSGTMIPGPPIDCGEDDPPVAVPVVSGPITFTRQ